MPITATLSFVAAAAMAGIPLSNGFLSKEMMLEEAAHTAYLGRDWLFPVLATAAALLSAAYSYRFAIGTFLGPARHDYPHHPHDPPSGMWLPIAVLVLPIVAIGIMPQTVAGPIVEHTARAVVGGAPPPFEPALWHGFTEAAAMSAIALVGGLLLFAAYGPANALHQAMPRPEAKDIYDSVTGSAVAAARRLIEFGHDGSLARYVGVMLVAIIAVGAAGFAGGTYEVGTRATLPLSLPGVAAWVTLVAASAAVAYPAPRPAAFAGADEHRRADRLDCLHAVLGARSGADPDHGRCRHDDLLLLALNLLPRESESRRAERAGCTPA